VVTISIEMSRVAMHQTTVRFGADLWSSLEREAARLGASAARYGRDATLARLACTEGVGHGRSRLPALTEPGRDTLAHGGAAALRARGVRAPTVAKRVREEKEKHTR
jgi:hypothetical protein